MKMMNCKKSLYIFSFFLVFQNLNAQSELGSLFSKTLVQSTQLNAAYVPENKVIVALPNYYAGYYNTFGGFVVRNNQTQTNQTVDNSWLNFGQQISMFGLSVRIPTGGVVSLHQNLNIDTNFGNDGDLFEVLTKGNAPFVGKTVDITPKINAQVYNEIGIGYAQKIGKLSVGGKIKRYGGWAAARTSDNAGLKLTTSQDAYQLNFDLDYQIEASENLSSTLNDLTTLPNFSTINSLDDIFSLSKKSGSGFGLDLAVNYDITDKLSVGASANNLGRIKWTGNAYAAKTKFDIVGVDIQQLLQDSSFNVNVPTLDTVFQKMSFTKSTTTFKTSAQTNFNVFGSYKINNHLTVNGLVGRTVHGNYVALNGTARLKQWLEAGLTYSVRNGSYSNLGTNLAMKLGPIQVYFIADNLLAIQKPLQSYNANMRIGANLAFGRKQ